MFDAFACSCEGVHFGTRIQAAALRKAGKMRIITAAVRLKKPLRVPDLGTWTFQGVHRHLATNRIITRHEAEETWNAWLTSDAAGWARIKEALANHGYDGFVYRNEQEAPGDSYVAFQTHQIRILDHGARRHRSQIRACSGANPPGNRPDQLPRTAMS